MAAKKLPSELPTFIWSRKVDPNDTFQSLDTFLKDLHLRLLTILNDHADFIDGNSSGTWTPTLSFTTPGDLSVTFSTQYGAWVRIRGRIRIEFNMQTSTFTHTTASGDLQISGLPFTVKNLTASAGRGTLTFQGITKVNYTQFTPRALVNTKKFDFEASGSGQSRVVTDSGDLPTGGSIFLAGSLEYLEA